MLEIWGTPMEIELDRNFEERGNSVWGVLRCRYLKFLCSQYLRIGKVLRAQWSIHLQIDPH